MSRTIAAWSAAVHPVHTHTWSAPASLLHSAHRPQARIERNRDVTSAWNMSATHGKPREVTGDECRAFADPPVVASPPAATAAGVTGPTTGISA